MTEQPITQPQPSAPSEEKKDSLPANPMPLTPEEAAAFREKLLKDAEGRRELCLKKINEILQETRCYFDVFVTVGTDGKISGEYRIQAKL